MVLADATVRRIVSPVRACLATAKREGLIRHNPADGAVLPHRPQVNDTEEVTRAMTRDQLAMFLRVVHKDWRLLFEFSRPPVCVGERSRVCGGVTFSSTDRTRTSMSAVPSPGGERASR